MHHIQQYVLARLATLGSSRYRDIKPQDVEGNLFAYHLNHLLKENLIDHKDKLYRLTASGLRYVGQLSSTTEQPRIQPKIVTLIACQNDLGQCLLYKRTKEPFLGLEGFPYGKIHLGETIEQAAKRELKEKTGLSATLAHIGEAYVITYKNKELISHMLFHVFLAQNYSGELVSRSASGQFFWEEIRAVSVKRFFPGFAEVFRAVSSNKYPFFLEVKKQV